MSSVTFKAGSAKRRNYRKRETTPGEDSPSTSIEAGDESLAQSKEEEELSYVNRHRFQPLFSAIASPLMCCLPRKPFLHSSANSVFFFLYIYG